MSLPGIVYPAAGLLPTVNSANETTSYFAPASGGGGGGGGTVLNVSTINFNNMGSAGNVPAQQNMRNGGAGAGGLGAFNGAVLAFDMDPGPVSTLLFGYNSANNALQITQNTNDVLTSGALQVDAILCSTINGAVPGGGGGGGNGSISVSSIRGFPGQTSPGPSTILVAPGPGGNLALSGYPLTNNPNGDILLDTGIPANALATTFQPGGAANAVLMISPSATGAQLNMAATDAGGALIASVNTSGNPSTLTVVSENVKFLDPTALGPTLNIRASDTNLYEIDCVSSSVVLAGLSIGYVGGRDQVYIDTAEAPNFYTSTIKGSTGQISLNPSGTEQIRIGGVGAPGDITIATVGGGNINLQGPVIQTSGALSVPGSASISSLTVSSINGAAPGGGSSITRTQVPTLQNVSVPGTGSATVISADFNPTNGHLYTLTGQVYGQVSPNVAAGSQIMFQIGNNGSVYQAPFPANGLITPFGTNILDVNMTWRHGTSGAERLYCYFWDPTNGANASTFTNAVANMDLIDYGPVA